MRNKNKRHKKSGFVTLLFAGVILAFCVFFATNGFSGAFRSDKTTQFKISQGMTGGEIASRLYEEGLICHPLGFRGALRLSGKAAEIKTGTYTLSSKMTYGDIINAITGISNAGRIKVTVPEGYKLSQVAEVMEQNGICTKDDFLNQAQNGEFDYAFLKDIPTGEESRLEGFLFPNTYFFDPNTDAHTVIDAMLKEFETVYTDDISAKATSFGMTTREFLTLASIIEKEGVGDLDKISSVFHNRLDAGMRLESCATVNYLFEEPKDVLSLEDTYIDSPYNTYRNEGLPPTPICSPGKAAIEAAANPADTDYLFFIADGQGGNLFSETFEEHKQKKGNR